MKKGYRVLLVFVMALLFTVVCKTGVQAAEDVTLKNGKWTNGKFTTESFTEQYYKINVKKTGYIKVEYNRNGKDEDADFQLCNAAKKEIVSYMVTFNKKPNKSVGYFGVKKGTYYIRIADFAYSNHEEDYDDIVATERYKLRYTFTAMKAMKTFKPKQVKKTQTIHVNQEVSGVVLPEKKEQGVICYKLNVPAKQTIQVSFEEKSAGIYNLHMNMADAKGKFLTVNKNGTVYKDKNLYSEWDGTDSDSLVLESGTYYFVIQTYKNSTGYYKLKLK